LNQSVGNNKDISFCPSSGGVIEVLLKVCITSGRGGSASSPSQLEA